MTPASLIVNAARRELLRTDTGEIWGSNWGPRIKVYQSVTRAFRLAWCASFVQFILKAVGAGPIADDSAGVFHIVDWARARGLTTRTPKPGQLVAFLHGKGHIGIVESVHPGGFASIEGNAGNDVRRRTHAISSDTVFITVPGETFTPRVRWLPRFQIVAGEGPKAHVVAGWAKWAQIRVRIPAAAARYRAVQVRQKFVKVTT